MGWALGHRDTNQSSLTQMNFIKNNLSSKQFLLAIFLTKMISSLLSYKTNVEIECSLFSKPITKACKNLMSYVRLPVLI